ncbi:MAG: nucleotidyltransferase [Mollicutes bacterium]|nr:nucleotidyltransferase [Mollicutes bacterium]
MKSVGIICEYNPFHNGHLYHLEKVKEICPDHIIVIVLGGNFMQRGETSIIDKWTKTKIALEMGIDLVIELPFVFASQGADIFARGSVELLNHLKVDKLIFGSELNDINILKDLADIQLNNQNYDSLVKKYMDKGINYPTALSKALYEIKGYEINKPNDILGISYIREIKRLNSKIEPYCIKRTNNYHSLELDSKVVSASSIREALKNKKDVKDYVPKITYQYLKNKHLHFIEDYFPYLKFKILTELNNLDKYQTVDEGIENRIKKAIIKANNLEELIQNIKTKRYTYNKIKRMLTHIMCNFTKEEAKKYQHVEYIRVLGFSEKGKKYLNKIKKDLEIPLITNYSKLNNDMLQLELRITSVYASILNEKDKTNLIESEYKNKPLIK